MLFIVGIFWYFVHCSVEIFLKLLWNLKYRFYITMDKQVIKFDTKCKKYAETQRRRGENSLQRASQSGTATRERSFVESIAFLSS